MKNWQKTRFAVIFAVLAAAMLLFVSRLMVIQIARGSSYYTEATQGFSVRQTIPAARGELVDRYGRPFVTNRTSYNIIFDKSFLPADTQNEIIHTLIGIMEQNGEEWIDSLPISKAEPFLFEDGKDSAIATLKKTLAVADYATAEECIGWLAERYGLGSYDEAAGLWISTNRDGTVASSYDSLSLRRIVGVRYEMERSGFSLRSTYTFAENVGSDTRTAVSEYSYLLTGVSLMESTRREYVDGTLAPHIIGITGLISAEDLEQLDAEGKLYSSSNLSGYRNDEQIGKLGLEKQYEELLRGEAGVRTIYFDNKGNVLETEETVSPRPGYTLVTTLDRDLQESTYNALEDRILYLQTTSTIDEGMMASAGAAVVLDVKTGEVLAAATYPSYDNATYYQDYTELAAQKPEPLLNRAFSGIYRPGSTFKPCVAVAGLQEGVISPGESIYCGGVYTRFSDYRPSCMHVDGDITVYGALQRSCNVFFYETGWRLGINRMTEYASAFGLGQPVNLELPTATGHLSTPEFHESLGSTWTNGNVIQSAIGQLDHMFSPLQLASYCAALANNGVRMQPHLVKSIRSYDLSEVIEQTEPTVASTVEADDLVWKTVRSGMVAVSKVGGTAYGAWSDFPMEVAAKTGTAQVSGDNLDSTYICYLPADDPQIAIAVVIEDGGQGTTGARVARSIADQYFFGSSSSEAPLASGTLLS